jgi:hypothetical protein
MDPMETTEWITYFPSSWEHESGGRMYLKVEVRIYEQDGEVYAEPLYYALFDKDDRIVLDNAHAGRHLDRMWKYVEYIVDDEFDEKLLDWYVREHPAFEMLRRERSDQERMDIEWARARAL